MEYRGFEIDDNRSFARSVVRGVTDTTLAATFTVEYETQIAEEFLQDQDSMAWLRGHMEFQLRAKIDAVLDGPDFAEKLRKAKLEWQRNYYEGFLGH